MAIQKKQEAKADKTKKIRKGDKVIALTGNSRGMTGVVQARVGDKFIVQGLNMRKKHLKRTQDAPQGRIIEVEGPIHGSNLKICGEGDKPVKLKVSQDRQGKRQLVYKTGDQEQVYRSIKKPK